MTPPLPPLPLLLPQLRAGAVIAPAGTVAQAELARFAASLASRGFRVAGMIQKTSRGADGRKTAMNLHPLTPLGPAATGIPMAQNLGRASQSCVIDESGVAEAAGQLRQHLAGGCDLLVISKFAHLESEGRGFHAEILHALSQGIPVLTTVPPEHLDSWLAFTGGATDLLPARTEALWRWWGPHRLYADLIHGVPATAGPVRRLVIGPNWTLVEGDAGVGLAQSPPRGQAGCGSPDASGWLGRPLAELAAQAQSPDPTLATLGCAALNAHYNNTPPDQTQPDQPLTTGNALDCLCPPDTPAGRPATRVTVIGAFPGLERRFPTVRVVDLAPRDGQLPPAAAAASLSTAEAVAITASTLPNHTLPGLLPWVPPAVPAVLLGPGTPLTPRLFAYGLTALGGLVIEDAEGCARAVAAGAGARTLKAFGRSVVLTA